MAHDGSPCPSSRSRKGTKKTGEGGNVLLSRAHLKVIYITIAHPFFVLYRVMLKPKVQGGGRECSIFVGQLWPQGILLTKAKGAPWHTSGGAATAFCPCEGGIFYYRNHWELSAHGNEKFTFIYFTVGKFPANSTAPDYWPSVSAPAAHLGTARPGRTGVGVTATRLTLRIVVREGIPWLSMTFFLASKLSPAERREGCRESH